VPIPDIGPSRYSVAGRRKEIAGRSYLTTRSLEDPSKAGSLGLIKRYVYYSSVDARRTSRVFHILCILYSLLASVVRVYTVTSCPLRASKPWFALDLRHHTGRSVAE